MSRWTTEFSVVARHYPMDLAVPRVSTALCTIAVHGPQAILHCERPDGERTAILFDERTMEPLLQIHDLFVPRLKIVPFPVPRELLALPLTERMRMFNRE